MNYIKIISILTILSLSMAKPAIARDNSYYRDSTESNNSINDKRANRGLIDLNNVFVPKGQWVFGGSVSYSTHINEDYTLLVVEDINSKGYTFKVSPMVSYALANNITFGARFIYGRTFLKIDDANITIGDSNDGGVSLVLKNYYQLKHSYSGMVISRQYIPLGKSKRYALFNEIQLNMGGSEAKNLNDSPVIGTYSTSFNASLGLSPGVVAFATNSIAIEVSVGVLGVGYSKTKQIHNQVTTGEIKSSNMNFKVNIFSIGFGIAFYL